MPIQHSFSSSFKHAINFGAFVAHKYQQQQQKINRKFLHLNSFIKCVEYERETKLNVLSIISQVWHATAKDFEKKKQNKSCDSKCVAHN